MSIKPTGLVLTVERADLDELCAMAQQPLKLPVVNLTGLTGLWDFKVDAAPYITPEVTSVKNPMDLVGVAITAVNEQLGLKVESRKMDVKLVVIDSATKVPTDN